ncbi:hypothetical protein A9P79_19285 [Cupriavidus taiwanensis]|nr:hypothetical protein A9P79_19285 [Cupriavidus taiwanensis]
MGRPDTITMSMRELDRCKVIQAVVEDGLMVWRAAEKLGISKRQIERLVHRYRQDGPSRMAFYSDKAGIFRVNAKDSAEGRGYTQFGRALVELNIDILCANSSPAKGRVERMNGTLQDRLVKELRLRGISTMAAANAFAPHFIADFNARFAKVPKRDFDAHRPLRGDEDLARIFSWREWRKVSASLTLQYDKVMYLLEDRPAHRRLILRPTLR